MACPIASASAGEYEVWSCRGPAGQALPADAWEARENDAQTGDVWVTDDCLTGGPLTLEMTSSGTGTRRARLDLVFDLPRGAKITGYSLRRAIRAAGAFGPPYVYVSAVREITGATWFDSGCASFLAPPSFNCSFLGDPGDPDDPSNLEVKTGLSLDGLAGWIGCISANGCNPPFLPPAAEFVLFEAAVMIEDDVPPVVESIGGALAGPDPVRGKSDLFVEASDDNAGVASFQLEIDGAPHQTIPVHTATCEEPFAIARPCPGDTGKLFTVDTNALGAGGHVATGTVTDAAGNQTAFGPVPFEVESPDPGPPLPDNGIPAVIEPVISLGTDAVWHRPDQPAVVRGRLLTDTGTPVAGASLGAWSTQLAVTEPKPVRLADAVTGSDGTFAVAVPGKGARQVEITFAPNAGGPVTSTSRVRVRSRLALSLKAKPGKIRIGKRVRFSGRLAGAGPSAAGVPVELQAKIAGKWETIATLRAKANGNWSWRYRFRYVKRKALFSFRALVRNAPGWPWPSVKSPVRKVHISVGRR